MCYKKVLLLASLFIGFFSLTGCVDQSQGRIAGSGEEKDKLVIVATSMAVAEICAKLEIELAGVPNSSLYELPACYEGLPTVGTAMAVDMEKISSLKPDWILSPVSLKADLQSKYDAQNSNYAFLNLNSVEGMYKSIKQLGELLNKEEQAAALVEDFITYYDAFREKHQDEQSPKVLILMGLPGSYVVACEQSYVGNLVKMAGGSNVYADEEEDFININTEDMLKKNPDIILRTAHALPEQVMEMFTDEFKTNDIWKHFTAVKEDKVFDLSYEKFGMSADFSYPEAIEELEKIFYE